MSRQQVGYWSESIASRLFHRNETTSFHDSDDHAGYVWKFPLGRPAVGDLVVVFASFDEVIDRGRARFVTRRILRVKPAEPREGQEYLPLWIGPPAPKSLILDRHGREALRRDPQLARGPGPIIPPVELPAEFCAESFL